MTLSPSQKEAKLNAEYFDLMSRHLKGKHWRWHCSDCGANNYKYEDCCIQSTFVCHCCGSYKSMFDDDEEIIIEEYDAPDKRAMMDSKTDAELIESVYDKISEEING